MTRLIWWADSLTHRLGLHIDWICDLLDISCGMSPDDLHLSGGHPLPNNWVNRLAWKYYR